MPSLRTVLDELTKAIVPSAIGAVVGTATLTGTAALNSIENASESFTTAEVVGIIVLLAVVLASSFVAVRIGLRTEFVRTLLKRMPPYEGIWLEEYKVNEPGKQDTDLNGNATYNSVMVVRTTPEEKTLLIYGMSFRQHNINYRSNYECGITHEGNEGRRIEMRYSGRWNGSNDVVTGYAWYEFDLALNETKRFTEGIVRFIEFGIEAGHSFPVLPGVSRRLERDKVRLAIQKRYPSTKEDYLALSKQAFPTLRTDGRIGAVLVCGG